MGYGSENKKLYLNNELITDLVIPDSVTSISFAAFKGCSELTSITLPFIGAELNGTYSTYFDYIFGGQPSYIPSSLKTVIISNGSGVTSIGEEAFRNCSGLTSITIPDSVNSIGSWAFSGCSVFENIYITDIAAWCNISGLSNLMGYGSENKKLYLNNELITDLVIPDSVTSIGSNAFAYCSGLTSITIPDSVTSIDGAFNGCSGLTSITIPDSVTSIGEWAFGYCSGLTSITIPDSVTSIGNYAFYNCSGLMSIAIPDSVTSIGSNAFAYCSGLTSITIPDSVTSIGNYAFRGCSGLTSIIIPDSVTSIGSGAFRDCSGLSSITLPFIGAELNGTDNTHFGYIFGTISFYENSSYVPSSLKTVIISNGSGVNSIGDYAFRGCSSLTSIVIPDSVTSIGEWAFAYCRGLTRIDFKGTTSHWNAITKVSNWNYNTGNYTIHCTDGTIAKS